MINCNTIHDLLPLYADGALSKDSEKLVREHLASCPICRHNYAVLRRQTISEKLPEINPDDTAFKYANVVKRIRRLKTVEAVAITGLLVAAISGIVSAINKTVIINNKK